MDFNKGDRVQFKSSLPLGHGLKRQGQIGIIIKTYDVPAQGTRVDIKFSDGGIEHGISVHQIEYA